MNLIIFAIITLLNFVVRARSAKILGLFFVPSVSHHQVFAPILRELSLRGHNVTAVTPSPLNDARLTNLTEINVSHLYNIRIPKSYYSSGYTDGFLNSIPFVMECLEALLRDVKVKNLCRDENDKKYDLVLIEALGPILYSFGPKCNAPVIGILSLEGLLSSHSNRGNSIHPSLYADLILSYTEPISTREKILRTYYFVLYKYFYKYYYVIPGNVLKEKFIGKELPSVDDSEKNASMLFINTNVAINSLRPLVPATVTMSFMQIKSTEPLPHDLQVILDNATEGVVYFSLGSNVRSSELSAPTVKLIKEALSEVPYTVLWKWETDNVPDVGPNVITRKWFPQQDVLAHKNLKGFVTQGGLQSTEEAINYGVPMVGIPFLGDQEMNVKQSMKQGISLYLDHKTMTKEDLKTCIMEIMQNPKYFERIQELKKIAQDQPMTGLEKAVWWSEYVIRHKGAKHLRSPVADMPLWEYLMLDVIAVVLSVLILTLFVLYKLLRFLFRLLFVKSKKVKKA